MVLACAVCFGQSDAPMAVATNMGIFLMLGVTTAVLAGFAVFFVHLARRARLFAGDDNAPPAAEGSARC
jgi:maltodextrin utilization protein YvdJ